MPSEKNYALVEGEWGKYIFKRILPADWERVITHINDNFLHDEPTSKLIGYCDQYGIDFGLLVKKCLADNLSFLVEEKDSKVVAAVRITLRHKIDTGFDDCQAISRQYQILLKVIDILENTADIFNRFGVTEFADFLCASTDRRYRKQGIVTEMYIRNLKFLKAEGFKVALSVFTSPYTRAAARNLGFKEVCRFDYINLEDDNRDPIFRVDELTSEHFAAIMAKTM